MWEIWVQSLGWEDPLEEGMATHSNILTWRIPWTVWGHKESNTTEQLTLSLFIVIMLIHSFLLVNISLFPGCLLSAKDYAGPEGESDESLGQ